jgi:hypothetical protein
LTGNRPRSADATSDILLKTALRAEKKQAFFPVIPPEAGFSRVSGRETWLLNRDFSTKRGSIEVRQAACGKFSAIPVAIRSKKDEKPLRLLKNGL